MANSEVSQLELNDDGTVDLYVSVYGYDAGTPVEISGSITQASGAVGAFYAIQEIPWVDLNESVLLKFTVPISPGRLAMGEAVTAIVRVTDTWITTLNPTTSAESSSWKAQKYAAFAVPAESPPAGAESPPARAEPPPAGAEPPPAGAEPPPAGAEPPPAGAEPPPAVPAEPPPAAAWSPVGEAKRWRPPRGGWLAG